MPMEIVCGRSKSGKSKYIYDKISSLVAEGKEVMLIVPEQFSHVAEKRLLNEVDTIRDGFVEVFSFAHLATATEARLGFAHVPKVDSVGKALIIKSILNDNNFSFYRNAGHRDGFVDMVVSIIAEFKKYLITPEVIVDIIQHSDDELLRMKLSDILIMYRAYETSITNSYEDSDDSLIVLANRLKYTTLFKNKYIFFDEFSTFVPQELEVIKVLSKEAMSVCVTLCMDFSEKNTTLFMPTTDTFNKLNFNGDAKITYLTDVHFNSAELKHLESNLYAYPARKYKDACRNIDIFSLANPLSEVEICAANIKAMIRDNGYMYRDIGVVCSDIDAYSRHIERIFKVCDIEYFIDSKNDIINHHLIRFVLGILEIYTNDYSYDSIFNYLKACFINAEPGSISLLERFIRHRNVRRSTWLSDEKWARITEANFKDDYGLKKVLNSVRSKYILPLARMHERIKGRHTAAHHAHVLYEYIKELRMPDTIADYIDKFTQSGEARLAKEYEKIWEIIVSTLDEIVFLSSDTKMSPSGFYDMLVTAFSQHKVGFIPSAIDRVIVGNTERTRFGDIKVLFVLGVNEGMFPMAPKPDGILGDADKESMQCCGVSFSTTSSIAAFYSQFVAYSTFTMPSDKLFISYSKSGNDFKSLRKSYIIDRLTKIFQIEESSEFSINELLSVHSETLTRQQLCRNLINYEKGMEVSPLWKSVYDYYKQNTEFIPKLQRFKNSDNIVNSLSDKNLKKLIPILSYTSVSKIERYMACKYAYFIDYVLKVEPIKEKSFDALDVGNITHMVLEKISKEFGKSRYTLEKLCDEDVMNRIEEHIDDYLIDYKNISDEISPRDEYAIRRLKNSIFLCFKAVKKQILDSDFEPLGYEIEFNDCSELGDIKIQTDDGRSVNLTGKIDRADICTVNNNSYIRVIDYKTGSKDFKLDEVFYGLSVQLMVYLNKLVSADSNFHHGGALYFHVSDLSIHSKGRMSPDDIEKATQSELKLKGIVPYEDVVLNAYDEKISKSLRHGSSKNKRVTEEDFKTIDAFLVQKLGCICGDMLRGNFGIEPYKKNNFTPCEYCKYLSVCRFDASNSGNDYVRYKSIAVYNDVIKEMEAMLNVDEKPTNSD